MDTKLQIRKSTLQDLDRIMPLYDKARAYMRRHGNMVQWIGGYPSVEVIRKDISLGNHYIGYDENNDVAVVFTFIIGADPTYSVIEDGEWPDDKPYGTIHRIASAEILRGVLKISVDYCFGLIDTIRIDTHADNAKMLSSLRKLGFTRCGVIHIADGTPREAFHKTLA